MDAAVLLYHTLYDKEKNRERYAISRREFEGHVRYLSENGFESVSLDAFFDMKHTDSVEKRKIVITFDDGNESDYSIAFPILKKYGLKATFFVTVKRISQSKFMGWPQLVEMAENGMSIQSHGLTHAFLNHLGVEDLRNELLESKQGIQLKLGTEVKYLSLPGGFGSSLVLNIAKEVGYKGLCTSQPGLNPINSFGNMFRTFNRMVITKRTLTSNFENIANGKTRYIMICRIQNSLKSGVKNILGTRAYYAVWSRFFKYD
jgi:peptidoglycan/xylan/chitin deacetylase (PgdA/CDA1 family)